MNSQIIKNVIVAGASGTIGAPIVAALLASGKFKVSVLTRIESKATFPEDVTVNRADFTSHPSLVNALRGQDALICTLNDESLGVQVQLIDAALEAEVKRFIPSEWGASDVEAPVPEVEEALAGRKAIIELLQQKAAESAGHGREFHWTAVNNGVFFDWALRVSFMDISLPPTKKALIWDKGSNAFSATNLSTVASAVISILTVAEAETRDRFVSIESFQASQNEIVQGLENVTGEKWIVERTTTEQQISESRVALASGDVLKAYYRWIVAGLFSGKVNLAFDAEKLDNKLLGLKEESLLGTVEKLVTSVKA